MNEASFPKEWVKCTIGDACALNPKEKLPDDLDVGFMPMAGVPTNHFGACDFEKRSWEKVRKGFTQFKNGDVIFAKITPCFENSKAAIIRDFPSGWGAGSTEYYVLRPYGDLVRPEMLFALIKSREFLVNGAVNMSGSVGHKRVPKVFVSGYELPLPPLAEQKVIADKLDTLLAQVENTKARLERIPQILKRFRQSVLAAAVSGRLIAESFEHLEYDLSDIAEKITDGEHITPKTMSHGIPLLSAKDVQENELLFGNVKYISREIADKAIARCNPECGDILIVSRGATVGRTHLVKTKEEFCLMGSVLLIKLNKKKVIPEYMELVFKDIEGQRQLIATSGSSAQQAIYIRDVKSFKLQLPSKSVQNKIVRRVDQLLAHADRIEQQVNNALSRVNNLTQSILAKAFRGELTEQWRKDNPELISGGNSAEALLNRIHGERASQKPAGRRTTTKKSEVSAT